MPAAGDVVELSAVLWAAPEGGFSALNPETATTSEGESQEEALSNLAPRPSVRWSDLASSSCGNGGAT